MLDSRLEHHRQLNGLVVREKKISIHVFLSVLVRKITEICGYSPEELHVYRFLFFMSLGTNGHQQSLPPASLSIPFTSLSFPQLASKDQICACILHLFLVGTTQSPSRGIMSWCIQLLMASMP